MQVAPLEALGFTPTKAEELENKSGNYVLNKDACNDNKVEVGNNKDYPNSFSSEEVVDGDIGTEKDLENVKDHYIRIQG